MVTFYNSIGECLEINKEIISTNDFSIINDFKYMTSNAEISLTDFAFKIENNNKNLIGLQMKNKPLLLLGDTSLASLAVEVVICYGLPIKGIIANATLEYKFSKAYTTFFMNSVDSFKTNDYSNYEEVIRSVEYTASPINKFMVAGGCFWCMSKPYYEVDGVKKVISGFAGGHKLNPTYEEVKQLTTGHKETILVYFNTRETTYKDLLTLYFESIDPFDDGGQFIDRGDNYTCAVFTNSLPQKNAYTRIVHQIETNCNKKVCVPLLKECIFYPAEEYHQDYALKNVKDFEKEEETSGRKNFEFIKLQ